MSTQCAIPSLQPVVFRNFGRTNFLSDQNFSIAIQRRYSSFGSDFNYDFHVTLDENIAPIEYNYRDKAELEKRNRPNVMQGESHGLSVFFRLGDDVSHTYSTYARGIESLTDAYSLLDMTPYGRQEDFEDSPSGWPQQPTYG